MEYFLHIIVCKSLEKQLVVEVIEVKYENKTMGSMCWFETKPDYSLLD